MIVELINTGTELLLGRVLNTHQQWLCRRLADLGYVVSRQVAVPDTGPAIQQVVVESLSRADLVVVTGGLGPTSDDITRDLIARLLGRTLREDPAIVAHIRNYFESRKRPMPESTRIQAQVPEGAIVLPNPNGTAPGLAMPIATNPFRAGNGALLVMLPGPPRELRPMFSECVVPLLQKHLPAAGSFACRTLRSIGIGESVVQEMVAPLLQSFVGRGLEIGYCARPGRVDVRLASSTADAARMVKEAEAIVAAKLGKNLYGFEDDDLETAVVHLLTKRGQTLALAESCTGGYISHLITNVPGASAVLLAGLVTYSNAAKQQFVGVNQATLEAHGAVSEPVAREMAEGIRHKTGADYALAVTGIAGPGGGTSEKPLGTVFIALARPEPTVVLKQQNAYDRETFKQVTAQRALDMLRRTVA
jgi:nicotinamide-nucleotide amidase